MKNLLLALLFFSVVCSHAPSLLAQKAERTLYRISLELDFDKRTYTGTERVRWVNNGDGAAAFLYFHLYPNLRAGTRDKITAAQEEPPAPDEPTLEVLEVRAAAGGQPLTYVLEDAGVSVRVQLGAPVAAGGSTEIEIKFKGSVAEIDPDETSLTAHLIQQVGAALRDTPDFRGARHLNFTSRGVMLLGSAFPILAARVGGEWQRKVESTVGDILHADVADYEVSVSTSDDGVKLFTSGDASVDAETGRNRRRVFRGESLRGFALVAGRALRSAEREVAGIRVRSIYAAEHERTGRRVLEVAAEAVKTFTARFGPLPFKAVTVAEVPLVAGIGSAEFSGLAGIASAFYVDFDSPLMRNLPEIVREQRASVEDSLEFTTAHMVAHQWWGASVGSDPAREPVLDEALAHWSALVYYRDVHGEERAQSALDDQLRGVYEVYRTFGGEDMTADRPARDYRNSFQYSAIVATKGALMIESLKGLLGERRFLRGLQNYYESQRLHIAELKDLRTTFADEADMQQRRMVARLFERWLSERHGDEDIAPPNPQLAAALGITIESGPSKDANAFARLGKFFWRRMTRIR